MLKELRIENYILIDYAKLEFSSGLNVLTGETGAGKSILINALKLALGEHISGSVLKPGASRALIEAVFSPNQTIRQWGQKMGLDIQDELIIRRLVTPKYSQSYINESPCTLQTISFLGDYLVDLHGQHQHQSLLHSNLQRQILDDYLHLAPLKAKLLSAYNRLKEVEDNLARNQKPGETLDRELDLLNYQITEIESAHLRPGEDEALEHDYRVASQAQFLKESSQRLHQELAEGDRAILDQLRRQLKIMQELAEIDERLSEWVAMWFNALTQLDEAAHQMLVYSNSLEEDPAKLAELRLRLDLINRLKHKYGHTIEDILQVLDRLRADRKRLEELKPTLANWQAELVNLRQEILTQALELSRLRQERAHQLSQMVEVELRNLGMPQAHFAIKVTPNISPEGEWEYQGKRYQVGPEGLDKVQFMVALNPGQELCELKKVASGGELSRIMLAIKSVFMGVSQVPVLVFDEIDLGIGGKMADVVAEYLTQLSKYKQVIVITHLAQIAHRAQTHFLVDKTNYKDYAVTKIQPITGEQRLAELARMLGLNSAADLPEKYRLLGSESNQVK